MASKRRLRRKKCGSKVRHSTEEAAINHAMALNRKNDNRPGYRIYPYRCQWCKHFHVGHHKKIVKTK